jgi:hypothetical protein
MRITIETDEQGMTASVSRQQQMQAAASSDQPAAAATSAPPDLLARAAALGAIDGGPAPTSPQLGSSSIPAAAAQSQAMMGAPAAGSSDQDAGAAPSGIEVVVQTTQENGTEDGDREGNEEDA